MSTLVWGALAVCSMYPRRGGGRRGGGGGRGGAGYGGGGGGGGVGGGGRFEGGGGGVGRGRGAGARPLSPSERGGVADGVEQRSPFLVVVEGASSPNSCLRLDEPSGLWVVAVGCPGAARPLQCCVAVKEGYVFGAGSATPVFARAVDPSSTAKVPWSKVGELSEHARAVFFQAEAPRFSGRPFQVWLGFDTRLQPPQRPLSIREKTAEKAREEEDGGGGGAGVGLGRGRERGRGGGGVGVGGAGGRVRNTHHSHHSSTPASLASTHPKPTTTSTPTPSSPSSPSSPGEGGAGGGGAGGGEVAAAHVLHAKSGADAVEAARRFVFTEVTELRRAYPRPAYDGVNIKDIPAALRSAEDCLDRAQAAVDAQIVPLAQIAKTNGWNLALEGTPEAAGLRRLKAGLDDFAGHIQAQFLDPITTRDAEIRKKRKDLVQKADKVAKRVDAILTRG